MESIQSLLPHIVLAGPQCILPCELPVVAVLVPPSIAFPISARNTVVPHHAESIDSRAAFRILDADYCCPAIARIADQLNVAAPFRVAKLKIGRIHRHHTGAIERTPLWRLSG